MSKIQPITVVCFALLLGSCGLFGKRDDDRQAPLGATTSAGLSGEKWNCQPSRERAWQCFDSDTAPPPTQQPEPSETPESGDLDEEIPEHQKIIAATQTLPAGQLTPANAEDSKPSDSATATTTETTPTALNDTTDGAGNALSKMDEVELTPLAARSEPASTLPPPPVEPPDDITSLLAYPDWIYVAQLVAARSQTTIDRLTSTYADSGRELFQILDPDSGLTLLLIGVFPDYQAAQRAMDALEPPLSSPPWLRRLGPLQDALKRSAD